MKRSGIKEEIYQVARLALYTFQTSTLEIIVHPPKIIQIWYGCTDNTMIVGNLPMELAKVIVGLLPFHIVMKCN